MIYTVILICYLSTIAALFLMNREKKQPEPYLSYSDVFEIINESVRSAIEAKHEDYTLRQVKIINDFEADVKTLTHKVMESFSDAFLENAYYYHQRDYILSYIARHMRTFLVEYTKKNLIETRKMSRG
ncbi:hypothetical protein D1872_36570 [compost metagenome]